MPFESPIPAIEGMSFKLFPTHGNMLMKIVSYNTLVVGQEISKKTGKVLGLGTFYSSREFLRFSDQKNYKERYSDQKEYIETVLGCLVKLEYISEIEKQEHMKYVRKALIDEEIFQMKREIMELTDREIFVPAMEYFKKRLEEYLTSKDPQQQRLGLALLKLQQTFAPQSSKGESNGDT